ncbi:MAG: dUTP diphosphatase [bacterium]
MNIKIKKIHPDAKIPQFAHKGDAGMDLYVPETVHLAPGERKSVPLGLGFEIPDGYVGIMSDKSGVSHKYGIKTYGGVIDSCYRGEIHAGVMNLSDAPYTFEKGHKIVQILIQTVEHPTVIEVDELTPSERGEGRFGSTGK